MAIDERALHRLIEQSEDLQADSMRVVREPLAELTERGLEQRSRGGEDLGAIRRFQTQRDRFFRTSSFSRGVLGATGFGAALLMLTQRPAWADQSTDVQTLQTAASIENLAVATYGTALTLDFIGGASANAVVKAFVMKTKDQHQEHADGFNAAVKQLGGTEQKDPDPVLLGVVNQAKPGLTGPGPVVALALQLENGAAETYVANTAALGDANARKVTASIMGVEAQHAAILYAVQALVAGGAVDLVALPPDAAKLPAAAGSVGFPDSFYKTDMARRADEGAVK
ncbi:MAG: ferritin-like domain-containing protein [Acidimicrobiia bacterium]